MRFFRFVARDHFHVIRKGTDLYVAGGRDSTFDEPAFFNEVEPVVEKFDLVANKWTRLPDFDRARGGSFAALHDGNVFVMGGEGFGQAWKEVHVLRGDTFERVEDMPTARHGAGAVSCNGVLWVAGGVPTQGGGTANTDTVAYYDGDAPNPCDQSETAPSVSTTPAGPESPTSDGTTPPSTTATSTTGTSISSTFPLVSAPTTTIHATTTSTQHRSTVPVSTSQFDEGVATSTSFSMPTEPSSVTTVIENGMTQQPISTTLAPANSSRTVGPTPTAVNAIIEASPVEEEDSTEHSSTPEDSSESEEGMGAHATFPTSGFIADVPEYTHMLPGDSPTTVGPATTAVGMTTSVKTIFTTHSLQPMTLTTVTSPTTFMTSSANTSSGSTGAATTVPSTTPEVDTTAPATSDTDTDESSTSGTGSSPGESSIAPTATSAPTKTPAPSATVGPVASEEPVPTDNFESNTSATDAEAGAPEPSQDTSSNAMDGRKLEALQHVSLAQEC